ncbi:MAG: hypothetical protein HeimC2_44000 [Candidatus Heimdallarchaeota archaeon LC_2]|nr:MAG: hypothetical protein HeimC2_44000 [Candidatus Heimdallarchaeota archaeon LC_2]
MQDALELYKMRDIDYSSFYKKYSSNYKFLGGTLEVDFVAAFLDNIDPRPDIDASDLLSSYRLRLYELIRKYVAKDPHGTWKYLKDLSESYKLGILSDNSCHTKEMWQNVFKDNQLDIFDFFIVSESVGVEKPNMRMFFEIRKHIDCPLEEVYFFGNNLIRDGAAAFYGMHFIHINGFSSPPVHQSHSLFPTKSFLSYNFINHDNLGLFYLASNYISTYNDNMVKSAGN